MPVTDSSTPKYTSCSGGVRWRTALAKSRSHEGLGHAVAERVGGRRGEPGRPGQKDLLGPPPVLAVPDVPGHPEGAGVAVAQVLHQAAVAVDPYPGLLAGLQEAVQRLAHRPVVQLHHQQRGPAPAPAGPLQRLGPPRGGHDEPTHPHRPGPGDRGHRGQRVGAVVGRRCAGPPVAPVADHRGQVGRLVQVLGLGVADLADVAGRIAAPHLPDEGHEGVVLGEHVDATGALGRLDQRHALGEGAAGGGLRQHAQAPLEGGDRRRGVLVEVVHQDDGVHGVGQERLQLPVAGGVHRHGRLVAASVVPLADRDHPHPGLQRQSGQGGAAAQAQHPDANGPAHQPLRGTDGPTTRA